MSGFLVLYCLRQIEKYEKYMLNTSVIMTTYNGEKYIFEQLESIRGQTLCVDEVLIFDDGSTDRTLQIIKNYIQSNSLNNWAVKVNDRNLGWKANFMLGSQNATGRYIFFCDQDDIWMPDKVNAMVNILENNENINLLCSNFFEIDKDGQDINGQMSFAKSDDSLEKIFFSLRSYYPLRMGCTFCVRNDFFKIVSKYWHYNSAHDAFLWRISSLTGSLYILNSPLIKYRQHTGGASKKKLDRVGYIKNIRYQIKVCTILRTFIIDNYSIYSNDKLEEVLNIRRHFTRRYLAFHKCSFRIFLQAFFFNHYPTMKLRLSDLYRFFSLK